MASIMKLLSVMFIILGVVFQGDAACSPFEPQGLDIVQSRTGNLVYGITEWQVSITNNCRCSQFQVKLFCNGFQTKAIIDPSILRISGALCLLNNGNLIRPSQSLHFRYASNYQFQFVLASSQAQCHS